MSQPAMRQSPVTAAEKSVAAVPCVGNINLAASAEGGVLCETSARDPRGIEGRARHRLGHYDASMESAGNTH